LTQYKANIFPVFDFKSEDDTNLATYLDRIPMLEAYMSGAPLQEKPVVTLSKAEVLTDSNNIESVEVLEFIITRRFRFGGELYVGGANGEALNVTSFISNFTEALKERMNHLK
jgi:hypothetical protein